MAPPGGHGAAEGQRAVKPLDEFPAPAQTGFHTGMPASASGHGNQAVGLSMALRACLLLMTSCSTTPP